MSLNTLDKDEIIQFSRLANDWWDEEGSMSLLHAMSEIRTKFIKIELMEHFNIKDKNKLFAGLNILDLGSLKINREEYIVVKNKNEIILPRKAFELLFLLASKPERVFKREEIMNHVWGTQVVVGDRTIDVHIRKLREKIGEKYVKTIKGVGYKFEN